jgi:hypothetical protein
MDAGLSPARQARTHRHELRTLTYVTLDQANGGIVRNLTHDGIGAQVVAAVRPHQQLRVRFELRYPRLRVEARGEVMWATFSGQCGIRFIDLPSRMARQIDEWIFSNLLDGAALHADGEGTVFDETKRSGLTISSAPMKVIELPPPAQPNSDSGIEPPFSASPNYEVGCSGDPGELDWLSRPLSGNSLAWAVNSLVVVAGLLLFALVFLVVTRELPKWPTAMLAGAAIFVGCFYWGFFKLFGGTSLGRRLARLAEYQEQEEVDARLR